MVESTPRQPAYACPVTHSPLFADGARLRNDAGDTTYPLRDGLPWFLRFEPKEDPPTREQLRRLNALAPPNGWREALRAVYPDEGMIRYVTQSERASFLSLLPLTPHSDVLEIGPGLGQFTPLLARRARSVWALEVVPGQAQFVAERCRQEGVDNVQVAVGGDDCQLPYAAGSFNVIVLNLVLEWCASRCADEPPVQVQRRLLAEMHRVLKPQGVLYLVTKNRYALRYLIGKSDEHCHGMRFGNALPRWLLHPLLRLRGQARPGGTLHSHRALGAMLRDAGFGGVTSFWAAPEMRYPAQYVPTDAASIRAARRRPGFVQGEGRAGRWLMRWVPAPLVRHVTPGLAFLATKPPGGA